MSRINTNVSSLIAQRVLGNNGASLSSSLERLSTGLKISRGKDDPAGLIASEALRAEGKGLNQALSNAERADQVASIAEGGLQEISGLLTELQGLVTQTANTAGLSTAEKQANQLQIDSILQTIDRVSAATSFQGIKLLNGNLDYTVTNVNAAVSSYKVNGAKLTFQGTRDVNIQVTRSAQVGALLLSFGGGVVDLNSTAAASAGAKFVIEIAGNKGSRELSFTSGTSLANVRDAVNTFKDVTGVSATVVGASGIRLSSVEFGSDAFVSAKVSNHAKARGSGIYQYSATNNSVHTTAGVVLFSNATNPVKDLGQDLSATINGITATTKGKVAKINTDFLDVEVNLSTTASQTLASTTAFRITGGGADFQLAGNVDIAGKVSVGISNVAVRALGRTAEGSSTYFLSNLGSGRELNVVTGDLSVAQKAVSNAINEVSSLRGRIGAFQKNTVGATIRSLGVSAENTVAAESIIRDADFATETSSLTRSQILVQSATQVLQLSNARPQNVLQLLG
ncbi:MAG: flagellin [Phycisphaerales bacterium]